MKTQHIFRGLMAVTLLMSAGQSLMAQEAFYIYRNDGDFNGFFYDEVKRMNLSKIDFDGVEHDDYVIQEVLTDDSLYRIPLLAIDSIGFQQPEIILNERLIDLGRYYSGDPTFPYKYQNLDITYDDPYVIRWNRVYYFDGKGGFYFKDEDIPKVGDILFRDYWVFGEWDYELMENVNYIDGPFIGKVREIRKDPNLPDDSSVILVVCDPIENLTDVFEQLISVEQLGYDQSGNVRSRMAGTRNLQTRASGNSELTLVSLNGKFPFSFGNDDFSGSISADVSLAIKANVAYQITRQVTSISVKVTEDAEVGVSFTAKGNLEDVTTWQIGGVPLYFPSILPIFQLNPAPGAFLKTTGDMSLTVSSPKFGYHGAQYFHLGTDQVTGSFTNDFKDTTEDDNNWSIELSLNGSMHAGTNFPLKLESNRWAEKAIYASIGADVYVGPKLSASFTLDPVALAKGDAYATFKNTNVCLAMVDVALEANAEYSFGNKPKKKTKFFEGDITFGQKTLKLFPDFEETKMGETYTIKNSFIPGWTGAGASGATIYPRGNSVPWLVGIGVYNMKKELISIDSYATDDQKQHTYGFFNTVDELSYTVAPLLNGIYYVVPIMKCFGTTVPAWGNEKQVEYWQPVVFSGFDVTSTSKEGTVTITNIMPDDEVEFELVEGKGSIWPNSEGRQTIYDCGDRVSFEEDQDARQLTQTVGPESLYTRTYKYYNMLKYSNTTVNSRNQITSEYNTYRVKVIRDGHVRYSNEIMFQSPDWAVYLQNQKH